MACSTNVANSTNWRYYVSGTAIGYATDATLTFSQEIRDTTNKDTGIWKGSAPGLLTASGSTSSLHVEDDTYGYNFFLDAMRNRSDVEVKFTSGTSGDKTVTGSILVTSLEKNSPGNEENVTYTMSFEFCGSPTFGTESA